MAGSVCLPNSRISTPGSESFPFQGLQVHSPILSSKLLDMSSKMLVKQRPKTDVYLEPTPVSNSRPKTAKLSVASIKMQSNLALNGDGKERNHREPFDRSNIGFGVRSGAKDYLSQKCNDIDMSGDVDMRANEVSGVLRDDEEYYMNMDPVEYFYSPIIDIFPISSCTARMTSTYPTALEKSLQSTSHFLPLIDDGNQSLHIDDIAKNGDDAVIKEASRKSSVSSRKSSFMNSSPLRKVPNKTPDLIHTPSQNRANNDKLLLPPISDQKKVKDEFTVADKHTNDNIGKSNSKNAVHVDYGLKIKSKIPVAKNYFLTEKSGKKTATKPSQEQHPEPKRNSFSLFRRHPVGFGIFKQHDVTQNQNYVSEQRETRVTKQSKLIDVTNLCENGEKYAKVPNDREKTVVIKEKRALIPGHMRRQSYHPQSEDQSNIPTEKYREKKRFSLKDKEDFWASTSKRFPNGIISTVYQKHDCKEKESGIPISTETSPKLLNDSTVALTSSKRPFTYDRVLIHKDDKETSPSFPKQTTLQTNSKGQRRPQSDKLNLSGIPTSPVQYKRELRPLKVRFHQMNF